jgi:hypothetical protein
LANIPLHDWQLANMRSRMIRTHAELIRDLGGPATVARDLGIDSYSTVFYWTQPGRRIPAKEWHRIIALPKAKDLAMTIDAIAAMPLNPMPPAPSESG